MEILRKERDQAVDERQIAVNMVGRKDSEIERLTSDVKVLLVTLLIRFAKMVYVLDSSRDDITIIKYYHFSLNVFYFSFYIYSSLVKPLLCSSYGQEVIFYYKPLVNLKNILLGLHLKI